ncbi:MAG: hypothetical protein NC453_17220 [Muribaculum sp.]|nr:hypothetical protein [Muribaculum sp.]
METLTDIFLRIKPEQFRELEELLMEKKRLEGLLRVDELKTEFEAKSGYLLNNPHVELKEIGVRKFVDVIFQREHWIDVDVPFEEVQSLEYKIWRRQQEEMLLRGEGEDSSLKVDYSGYRMWRYNPVVFCKEGKRAFHRLLLKDDGDSLQFLAGRKFAIMPPVTFVGNTNSYKNARFLYAFAIDLDGIGKSDIEYLLTGMNSGFLPKANIIVNSGHGLHLYYLLARPIEMFATRLKSLNKLKEGLTRKVWLVSRLRNPQIQSVVQGFRLPGTMTKFGKPIRAFINPNAPLHDPRELNETVRDDLMLSREEVDRLMDSKPYNPAKVTLEEAKKLWPEWYAQRVIGKKRVGKTWNVNRGLYDWWFNILKIGKGVEVHHRYWCILTLVVYAVKCGIPRDEVLRDALTLVVPFNKKSDAVDNPFIEEDVMDAMRAYDEEYNKWPVRVIEATTGIRIDRCRRNGRTQINHLSRIRKLQEVDYPEGEWRKNNGRKPGSVKLASESRCAALVKEWRDNHPQSENKSLCARETGLSRPTVIKWWNDK